MGTGDAKLALHMYTASTCVPLKSLFLWGGGCARYRTGKVNSEGSSGSRKL